MSKERFTQKGDFNRLRDSKWCISFRTERKTPHISLGLEQESYKGHREFFEYFNRYDLKSLEAFADALNESIRMMKEYIQK